MIPFQIKICGITTPQDAIDAISCGADAIGLNFYRESPRFVDESVAKTILESITAHHESTNISPTASNATNNAANPKIVGVFVNLSAPEVVRKTVTLNLDGIQLHGDETPSVVSEIRRHLQEFGYSCELIRAIRNQPASDELAEPSAEASGVEAEIAAWSEAGINAILLDAAVPGEFGGTGKVLDWRTVPRLAQKVPLILAGGLNPGNVASAIEISKVRSVDVASGVESSPGRKDPTKVKAFVQAAKRAFGSKKIG
jgi:phosphoribosylanthranilate isomerase